MQTEGRVIIHNVVLEDKDAALLLSDLDREARVDTIITALRLMYRHGRTGVHVDFVRREFEQAATEIKSSCQRAADRLILTARARRQR